MLCASTAVWFGFLARRANRGWLVWTIGGALFALVASTIVIGLGNAAHIPMSHAADVRFKFEIVALACLLVFALGWLFTLPLHGSHRPVWAWLKGLFKPLKAASPGRKQV